MRPIRPMGRNRARQSAISQWRILGVAYRRAVAGSSARLWWLEKCTPPLLPLARQGQVGTHPGNFGAKPRLRMADDWRVPLQGSSARSRCCRREPRHGTYKRGLNTKIHLAVDADGMPVRVLVTSGTVADCKRAVALIDGLFADYLLADKGYDTNEIIQWAIDHGMIAVIPPKKNRLDQREYDHYLYRLRHLVENAFLKLKQWRGIATRFAKNTSSFLAAVQIRCFMLWAGILA